MKTILNTNPSHTYLRLIGMIVVFLGCIASTFAQTQISGTIIDETGEAIPGVTVVIQGTSQGSVTGIDGSYAFSTSLNGDYILSISFVGYKRILQPVSLGSGSVEQNFQLELDMIGLDEVVVTGVVNPKSKLESSVSVTTLEPKTIAQSAPRTTAEIFRTIPGIKAEASAGDGNTNITVRGVPISAGGSRYLQLQEDGLPVLLYGDIAFSTQDQYVRFDQTIDRVEAIRGGSAATTTSNGPAGIVNFISKTGSTEGGSVGTSFGVNYNSLRTDFEYGSPIGNNTSFHIGGFFRQGEGPRNANHTVNQGGQIKANLTKYFNNGLARVYYKMLNDRTAAYMPMPIQVSGTNSDPTWESVPGFDAVSNGLQTPFFQQNFGLGPDGNARNVDVSDGIHTNTHAVGAYLEFDLPNDWTISNNSRMAFNSGRFVAPFTAQVGTTASIVEPILIANGDTTAAGAVSPYTMNRVANGSTFSDTPNGLIQRIHLFDVELENFNNFMSDTQLKKSFGELGVTFGLFKAYQNIEMSWLWNTYLMEVGEDADLVNVSANGANVTDDGLVNYGVPLWGNCCTGKYNTNYDVTAPYLSASYEVSDELNIDASIRYDNVRVAGMVTPSQQVANFDINGNGTIDAPERSVSRVDNANAKIVNYSYDYVSYSFGANYLLSSDNAVFGRVSQGYVGNGERATWHQGGPYLENGAPKNSLFQAEVGYKKRFNNGGLFVTGFYAKTEEEAGVEATTQRVLSNDYRSYGLEIESNFRFNALDFRSAITYVNAEIVDNDGNTNIGNTPRRQPALQYNLLPSYNFSGGHAIGLSLIGQTKAYAQDNNELIMPGYMIVNAYVAAQLSQGLVFSLNANNLTNTIGITESEEGSITENATNYIRARSIAGRSIVASLNLTF
ncbi:TonB-dependent receptor [Ekhidna sp.]|uniref:TonB-dependent receptor n=1 Tax=Ekhidna sp. TaxID=2608089 RepID=UPI0032EB87B1